MGVPRLFSLRVKTIKLRHVNIRRNKPQKKKTFIFNISIYSIRLVYKYKKPIYNTLICYYNNIMISMIELARGCDFAPKTHPPSPLYDLKYIMLLKFI